MNIEPEVATPGTRAEPEIADSLGRVFHVLGGLSYGGNETLCYQLMLRLPARERLLLNFGPDGELRSRFEALPGFRLFEIPYRREARLRFVWEVWRLFRRFRPRAVICYPFGLHVLVGLAARLAGVRRILVSGGNPVPPDPGRRRQWRWILWASTMLGTQIVSCSRYVDREFRRLTRFFPRGSLAIYSGIDGTVAERARAARAVRTDATPVIGMVARLDAIKDQASLLRAMAEVRLAQPTAQLWIVGDGDERPRLEALAAELGIGAAVCFMGRRGDVPELLGQMDLLAFSTTRDEGLGMAITEALSAGLPVVASDVPACREALMDGRAGLLVPPGDPAALAGAITALLADSGERARWSERAITAAPEYSVERSVKRWQARLEGRL